MDTNIALMLALCLTLLGCASASDGAGNYKMCVPHQIYETCVSLTAHPSTETTIECVSARDRMECLQLVEQRKADFVAVDPEDMYVAFNMKNEDFGIFSEIRTREERDSPFRYLGIILVHKGSAIRTLADLKGRKSCHTGYGRNVGYKIPITKLKAAGVLKIAEDPSLSYVEKELQGLTDLFAQSCLVGKYSPNAEVNAALKKRYANLCALCEDPVKCDYPDKYSGYDGSIRCLAENGGDVAFTKVIFVNRYFGLPVGNNPATTEAQRNPDDFEYLCADGTRRPVTGTPCTWAQRPWQAYMANFDVLPSVEPLQHEIEAIYTAGQEYAAAGGEAEKARAAKLWIDAKNVVVARQQHELPGEHLEAAQYRDVIERDGNMQLKVRLCVRSEVEHRKCDLLRRVAFARDIRPQFECVLSADCLATVKGRQADAAVVPALEFGRAHDAHLKPIAYEVLDATNPYVAVVAKTASAAADEKTSIAFDEACPRQLDVALLLRHGNQCPDVVRSDSAGTIRVMRAAQLPAGDADELVCVDGTRKPLAEWKQCNFNGRLHANGVFARAELTPTETETYAHGFVALSEKFGHGARTEEVFELFGEFEPGQKNVLFGDDSAAFVAQSNEVENTEGDKAAYKKMHCM